MENFIDNIGDLPLVNLTPDLNSIKAAQTEKARQDFKQLETLICEFENSIAPDSAVGTVFDGITFQLISVTILYRQQLILLFGKLPNGGIFRGVRSLYPLRLALLELPKVTAPNQRAKIGFSIQGQESSQG